MKTILFSIVLFSSVHSYAKRCVPDINGNQNFKTRCEAVVESTSTSECHILRAQGQLPTNFYPIYHVHPWHRVNVGSTNSACDVDLQGCQDFAFRELEKLSYVNNCGDLSVGKSVEFKFFSLNLDGSINNEVSGRFKKY